MHNSHHHLDLGINLIFLGSSSNWILSPISLKYVGSILEMKPCSKSSSFWFRLHECIVSRLSRIKSCSSCQAWATVLSFVCFKIRCFSWYTLVPYLRFITVWLPWIRMSTNFIVSPSSWYRWTVMLRLPTLVSVLRVNSRTSDMASSNVGFTK